MGELKKVRVREATPRDLGLFRKLWHAYATEPSSSEALVAQTEQTHAFYDALFKQYTESDKGFVLLISDCAVLVAGEVISAGGFKDGKIAQIWGVYVSEKHRNEGLATILQEAAQDRLADEGFSGVTWSVRSDDALKQKMDEAGYRPYMSYYFESLGDA